jgi:uncharacterized OB-fold protein
MLVPTPDEESAGFWEGTKAGELRMQACRRCGRRRNPPRPMCPHCQSTERGWDVMSGTGTVWSYVIPHPPLLPAYQPYAPYNVITVSLDDDPNLRVVGNLVTEAGAPLNGIDPHSVQIGEPVRVVFSARAHPDPEIGEVWMPEWVRA